MATKGKQYPKRSKTSALTQDNYKAWFLRKTWNNSDLLVEMHKHVSRHTSIEDDKVEVSYEIQGNDFT